MLFWGGPKRGSVGVVLDRSVSQSVDLGSVFSGHPIYFALSVFGSHVFIYLFFLRSVQKTEAC